MPYKDKEKRCEHGRQYYQLHREEKCEYQREWNRKNYEKMKNEDKERYEQYLAYFRTSNRRQGEKTKLTVINHYSNGTMACANPYNEHKEPYTNLYTLTVDHINGGGWLERKGYGAKFYRNLIKSGFPSGFQILCMNCQWIKRRTNHELSGNPHPYLAYTKRVIR
jgi:hypothetical protein